MGPAGAITAYTLATRANFRLLEKYRELIGLFTEVLMGREGFSNLLSMLKRKMGLKGKMAS